MPVLQRFPAPATSDVTGLYFKGEWSGLEIHGGKDYTVTLAPGKDFSFNTYFNSIYTSYLNDIVDVGSGVPGLTLEMDVKNGPVTLELWTQSFGKAPERVATTNLDGPSAYKLPVAKLTGERAYFTVRSESKAQITSPRLVTGSGKSKQTAGQAAKLAVVSCTFRKEPFITETVKRIAADPGLLETGLEVFVIDNGRTLKEKDFGPTGDWFHLIGNENLGGAGGFTRGILAALQAGGFSHIILMDDDITLETEALFRMVGHLSAATEKVCLAGTMLDLIKPNYQYEAGALFYADGPYVTRPLNHKVELSTDQSLMTFDPNQQVDYGGWWFFAFPVKAVADIGLPLPLFIKMDDMEYGLRLSKNNYKVSQAPGIAVWHEPFYAKDAAWQAYYNTRNHSIVQALYDAYPRPRLVKVLIKQALNSFFRLDYDRMQLMQMGLQDFLKGPAVLMEGAGDNHMRVVRAFKSRHAKMNELETVPDHVKEQFLHQNDPEYRRHSLGKQGLLKKLFFWVSLGGHLVPRFLLRRPLERELTYFRVDSAFGHKAAHLYNLYTLEVSRYPMRTFFGIGKLASFGLTVTRFFFSYWSVKRKWKSAEKELKSHEFWQRYLQLD